MGFNCYILRDKKRKPKHTHVLQHFGRMELLSLISTELAIILMVTILEELRYCIKESGARSAAMDGI